MAQCNERCSQVAIEALRIYNGARLRQRIERTLALSDFRPTPVDYPLTYVSARSDGEAVITAQSVQTYGTATQSRVSIAYEFPVTVTYVDARGQSGTARGTIADGVDLLLTLPTNRPYYFAVDVDFRSLLGEIEGTSAQIRGCLLTTVKVLTKCDLIIDACCLRYPSGRTTDDDVCRVLFGTQT